MFGCLCFSSTLIVNKKKFDPRATTSIFLGFKPNTKGYITLDLKTRAISISRNVILYEGCFPFTAQDKPDPITVLHVPTSSFDGTIDQFDDFPSEPPIDHTIVEPNDTDLNPSISQKATQAPRQSMRQIHRPSKYKDSHITYPSSTIANLSTIEPQSYNGASKDPS